MPDEIWSLFLPSILSWVSSNTQLRFTFFSLLFSLSGSPPLSVILFSNFVGAASCNLLDPSSFFNKVENYNWVHLPSSQILLVPGDE